MPAPPRIVLRTDPVLRVPADHEDEAIYARASERLGVSDHERAVRDTGVNASASSAITLTLIKSLGEQSLRPRSSYYCMLYRWYFRGINTTIFYRT